MRLLYTLLLVGVVLGSPARAQKQMSFNADGTFKLLLVTDMHINQRAGKSEAVFALIDEMIRTEKPDLVVFGGDLVTERGPRATWDRLLAQMGESGVAWTMVFGNHDHEHGMTRDEIYDLVAATPGAVMERGPAKVKGTGNFVLELLSHATGKPANIVYFMDSHAKAAEGGGYAWIDRSQMDWYREQSDKYRLPALAFFHIPLPEFAEAAGGRILGLKNEEVCCPGFNSGLFAAMQQQGDVCGIFVGHDHDNDFISNHKGIALAYGRVSGGGSAYGDLPRGARVVILREGAREFKTYIRLASGEIIYPCSFPEDF